MIIQHLSGPMGARLNESGVKNRNTTFYLICGVGQIHKGNYSKYDIPLSVPYRII